MNKRQRNRLLQLILRRSLDFKFDGIVFHRSNLSRRKIVNFLLSRVEGARRRRQPSSYPIALQLEPTTLCQLSCPLCPRQVIAKGEGDGLMPWESYRKLIDEVGPYLMAIALWRWGEPLLHPQIVDMVEAARRREVLTMISTNAQAQPESLDLGGLFRAGLDLLIISMDGATQETQSHFRKGSRLDAVRRFTETAVTMRRNLGLTNPVINLRTIAVRENESEIGQLLGFARTVGVDYYTVKSVSLYYDDAPTNPELPLDLSLRSLQYRGWEEARQYRDAPNHCLKPWSWPTLGHDGTLLACECDHRDERPLGNVFTAPSFRHVWRGADAQELRSHFPADGRPDCPFCLRCRYKLDDAIPIVRYLRADRP